MDIKNVRLEELREKVKNRETLVTEIVDFVEELMLQQGSLKERKLSNGQPHSVLEFKNFNGFSFIWATNSDSLGRNNIQISYRRGELNALVFTVNYFDGTKQYEVLTFIKKGDWLQALSHAMQNKDEILAKIEAGLSKEEKASLVAQREEEDMNMLLQKARELGL
jgi:hypothetical protein